MAGPVDHGKREGEEGGGGGGGGGERERERGDMISIHWLCVTVFSLLY